MDLLKIAAFANNGKGGNPAGVVIGAEMPSEQQMQEVAKQVGYSETAFLAPKEEGWRVRYFSPEVEVPFCGHATIASGAALGEKFGAKTFALYLNDSEISVEAIQNKDASFRATLQSPKTWSKPAKEEMITQVLQLFHLKENDLNPDFPVYDAFAGAKHLILFVKDKDTLAAMSYLFDQTKILMIENDIGTISLLWKESNECFHSRNAFAGGGVYEDPATGAAAAALGGYLRDIGWKKSASFSIIQRADMGFPSKIDVEYGAEPGSSVKVSGEIRHINDA